MASSSIRCIVGLGNPGKRYARTRHNLGFLVVEALAERFGWSWKKQTKFEGWTARGLLLSPEGEQQEVHLLKPTTFMNLSGRSVRRYLDWFRMGREELLVICDDTALPFGELRLRSSGSHGGHNGLRSIEEVLSSREYARLRLGIGSGNDSELSDYVLERFSAQEEEQLDNFLDRGARAAEEVIWEGVESVMNRCNRRLSPPQKKQPALSQPEESKEKQEPEGSA